LKKAQASDVRSLGLLVSGAEKMPLELHASFLETLQVEVMQGYGLTETTPVTNMNIEDDAFGGGQVGKRLGSVGRMLPGITARIVDPDTGEALPLNRTGMLLFRGENVFGGYLKDPEKTKVALRDGWFVTGDLARFDEDGFLFIEGRLSRFSKIGGEMVPHGTIEQKINSLFGFDQRDAVVLVVVGVPDASKGEALVVITTEALAAEEVREKLSEAGFANLWIPRVIKRVEKIPLLGTGKVDMQACKRIAVE
jgi:acyl-[acyl-carrier-protein]-phospholipid O-acyltransferase/long-chain-fatty-acid--[acyl-carrier-protein] ligase